MILLTNNNEDEELLKYNDFNLLKNKADLYTTLLHLYYDDSKFIYLPYYIITRIINVNEYKKIKVLEEQDLLIQRRLR